MERSKSLLAPRVEAESLARQLSQSSTWSTSTSMSTMPSKIRTDYIINFCPTRYQLIVPSRHRWNSFSSRESMRWGDCQRESLWVVYLEFEGLPMGRLKVCMILLCLFDLNCFSRERSKERRWCCWLLNICLVYHTQSEYIYFKLFPNLARFVIDYALQVPNLAIDSLEISHVETRVFIAKRRISGNFGLSFSTMMSQGTR